MNWGKESALRKHSQPISVVINWSALVLLLATGVIVSSFRFPTFPFSNWPASEPVRSLMFLTFLFCFFCFFLLNLLSLSVHFVLRLCMHSSSIWFDSYLSCSCSCLPFFWRHLLPQTLSFLLPYDHLFHLFVPICPMPLMANLSLCKFANCILTRIWFDSQATTDQLCWLFPWLYVRVLCLGKFSFSLALIEPCYHAPVTYYMLYLTWIYSHVFKNNGAREDWATNTHNCSKNCLPILVLNLLLCLFWQPDAVS